MRFLYLTCALIAACSLAQANFSYSYQDGALTDTVSVDGIGPGDAWWANQFYTQVGGEAISSITLAFGPHDANLPVKFLLYNDPDGNGLPNDLALLAQMDLTLGAFNPDPGSVDTFATVTFPTPVSVGPSFFVALLMLNAPGTADARSDSTATHGQSWFAGNNTGGTFDPSNPNGADLPPTNIDSLISPATIDFEITAAGVPGTQLVSTPEPGSLSFMAIGLAAFAALRKGAS